MKKYVLLFLFFGATLFSVANPSLRNVCFSRQGVFDQTETLNKTFGSPADSVSLSANTYVKGLCVDGTVTILSDNHFVRILLEDDLGNKYVVLESYEGINNQGTINLNSYCEESIALPGVIPTKLKVFSRNATVFLSQAKYVYDLPQGMNPDTTNYVQLRELQLEEIVASINQRNIQNNKLWRAGVTPLSMMGYDAKKRILQLSDDGETGGIEFYVDGIFELGEDTVIQQPEQSPMRTNTETYVDYFDWRNRHGINWMTQPKNQGASGYCTAFAVASVMEAMTNIYFNRKLDFDVSEEEIASCCGQPNPYHGIAYNRAVNYVTNHGACDEDSYPFADADEQECESENIVPYELTRMSGSQMVVPNNTTNGMNSIKHALINNGPLVSGIRTTGIYHAMALVGYATLHAGDTIRANNEGLGYITVIPEGDERIGKTYWIFKNSYGIEGGDAEHQGYMYILPYFNSQIPYSYSLLAPVFTTHYSSMDVLCEDRDGDGFYYWGCGPKPAECPSWIPDEPDGDDSDDMAGPMDEYGNLMSLNPYELDIIPFYNTTITSPCHIYQHILLYNNTKLTISSDVTMGRYTQITVYSGGELNIDAGTFRNVKLELRRGAKLNIRNGGKLIMRKNESFDAVPGVLVSIEDGEIVN